MGRGEDKLRKPVVMVMIDQATRDAFSQLLVVHYLRSRGARVIVANQTTWVASWERYRPDVVYISWLGGLMKYIRNLRHRPEIVLMDQEGGRLGEVAFKRSFVKARDDKADLGRQGSLAFAWGRLHKGWLGEMDIISTEKVLVTGSPRLDPYLDVKRPDRRYIGVTLRADMMTAVPRDFVSNVFEYATLGPEDWISVGYPRNTQHEDRIWHVVAGLRYIFKILIELRRHTDTPVVLRPGPWEQYEMYEFLTRRIKNVSIAPAMAQEDYVRNALVIIDECSSLGLEAVIADTPVISTQALIPRLEEHIGGGEDAGLFNAPYKKSYWLPKSIEEAVQLVLQAEKHELATVPDAEATASYLRDFHTWPRSRPSSFQIGDAILELAMSRVRELRDGGKISKGLDNFSSVPQSSVPKLRGHFKSALFRHVPGSVHLLKLQLFLRCLFSSDRTHLRKYHYLASLYPHSRKVRDLFDRLNAEYGRIGSVDFQRSQGH